MARKFNGDILDCGCLVSENGGLIPCTGSDCKYEEYMNNPHWEEKDDL